MPALIFRPRTGAGVGSCRSLRGHVSPRAVCDPDQSDRVTFLLLRFSRSEARVRLPRSSLRRNSLRTSAMVPPSNQFQSLNPGFGHGSFNRQSVALLSRQLRPPCPSSWQTHQYPECEARLRRYLRLLSIWHRHRDVPDAPATMQHSK